VTKIDPITLEVVTEGLISVVREMRATVFRTARSVAIYEARDFSCGLFDARGQVVAQSEDIGAHVVPLPWSVESALEDFGDDLFPGDVILMNDPYRGGTHLNDVTIIYPVFENGELVFFPAVREHWADVGGAVPGSMSGTATEIYQEGMRIPPIKILEKGEINKPLLEVLLSNMRVRDERLGDFNSSLAACKTAERRLNELTSRYSMQVMLDCVDLNLRRSENRMRENINALPNGQYYYEDYMETFGPDGFEPLLLPLNLTITDDEMTADFTGASPQVPAPVNSTLAVTAASVYIALKSTLDPAHALNHGSFRPLHVVAPEKTIVNVGHPAPAGSHGEIRKRVIATMLGALSRASPELVSADIHRTSFHNLIGGIDPASGSEYVHYEWACGGNGGLMEADGPSAMAAIDWGDLTTVQSTEVLENRFPLHVERAQLGIDSGGPGQHRGGFGMRRSLRLTRGTASYSLLSDGAIMPPFGIHGGESGAPVDCYVIKKDGGEHHFSRPGKVGGYPLSEGDTLVLQSAAGGGYGDALSRKTDAVSEDVKNGLVSIGIAEKIYGVQFNDANEVDENKTGEKRAELLASRAKIKVKAVDNDPYVPSGPSKRRVISLNPLDIKTFGLKIDQKIELLDAQGPPLRGWVRSDETVVLGTVCMDTNGMLLLGVEDGKEVQLRPLNIPSVTF